VSRRLLLTGGLRRRLLLLAANNGGIGALRRGAAAATLCPSRLLRLLLRRRPAASLLGARLLLLPLRDLLLLAGPQSFCDQEVEGVHAVAVHVRLGARGGRPLARQVVVARGAAPRAGRQRLALDGGRGAGGDAQREGAEAAAGGRRLPLFRVPRLGALPLLALRLLLLLLLLLRLRLLLLLLLRGHRL
jgi:hypothetical protein